MHHEGRLYQLSTHGERGVNRTNIAPEFVRDCRVNGPERGGKARYVVDARCHTMEHRSFGPPVARRYTGGRLKYRVVRRVVLQRTSLRSAPCAYLACDETRI